MNIYLFVNSEKFQSGGSIFKILSPDHSFMNKSGVAAVSRMFNVYKMLLLWRVMNFFCTFSFKVECQLSILSEAQPGSPKKYMLGNFAAIVNPLVPGVH